MGVASTPDASTLSPARPSGGLPENRFEESTVSEYPKFFIGGEWVEPAGTGTLAVINSATEEVMGHVPEGTPADVDRAVTAARAAFEPWAATPTAGGSPTGSRHARRRSPS
jgi:delta 1-pyrroline-5-carboxylate dehydrogenase